MDARRTMTGVATDRWREGIRSLRATVERQTPKTQVLSNLGAPGEPLILARGDARAAGVRLVLAGINGHQGLAGARTVQALLERHGSGRDGLREVFVVGLDPSACEQAAPVDAEGIDLDRNWYDFHRALPNDDAYARLHPALVYAPLDGADRDHADATLADAEASFPQRPLVELIESGQYHCLDGLRYGGRSPSAARRAFEPKLAGLLGDASTVEVWTVRAGLGDWGRVDLVPGARIGTLAHAIARDFSDRTVRPATLTLGTFGVERGLQVLRDDTIARIGADRRPDARRRTRTAVVEHFAPADPRWQARIEHGLDALIGR